MAVDAGVHVFAVPVRRVLQHGKMDVGNIDFVQGNAQLRSRGAGAFRAEKRRYKRDTFNAKLLLFLQQPDSQDAVESAR
jgi:hypothetical protein